METFILALLFPFFFSALSHFCYIFAIYEDLNSRDFKSVKQWYIRIDRIHYKERKYWSSICDVGGNEPSEVF